MNKDRNIRQLLGARIRELRRSRKLTQENLAETVKVDTKHISLLENGKTFPSAELLERIVEAFDVDYQDLFKTAHNKDRVVLIDEINSLLKGFNDEQVQLAYRILIDINN